MEIVVEKNKLLEKNEYIVREVNGKFTITMTWMSTESDIKHWWENIKKIYRHEFRAKTLVIGLCADRGIDATITNYYKFRTRKAGEHLPYELLQICVGNHCLLGRMGSHCDTKFKPRGLADILHEPRATIVGVGIDRLLSKLASDCEWTAVPLKTADLGAMAATATGDRRLRTARLAKLSGSVLGDDMRIVKLKGFAWDYYHNDYEYFASFDDLKYASVEAFLTSRMGRRLLFPSTFGSTSNSNSN